MSPNIHPSSIVHPSAKLADGVCVGPFCTVGPHVSLGAGTTLKSHVVVDGHTTLGENNTVFPFTSLGLPPPDLKHAGEATRLMIGDNNIIRENVTMHTGTISDRGETTIGNHNLIMPLAHIAHDCVVGDQCILANGATLAGHVSLENGARIGGLTAVAQFVRIGAQAFIGGHAAVHHDVPPFVLTKGPEAEMLGVNMVGLRRKGVNNTTIRALSDMFKALFHSESTQPILERATYLRDDLGELTPEVAQFLDFVLAGARVRQLEEKAP